MGSGKHRWNFSFHRSSSMPTPPPPPPLPPPPPREFLCPISNTLMTDPVIVPSGLTFERSCIQACIDLSFTPPSLSIHFSSSPFLLIPNVALKSTILNWCDLFSLPHPLPIHPHTATHLVQHLITSSSPSKQQSFYSAKLSSSGEEDLLVTAPDTPLSTPTMPPYSSSPSSSSSSHSSEIFVTTMEEEEFLTKLKHPEISHQESALVSLRQATRERRDHRVSLCTPTLLAALRPMLLSHHSTLQANAAAALVNLSLEPLNKVPIVRSGAVPPLIDALKSRHADARAHSAAALFSLSLEAENRAAIGVLGAVPPLLHLFSRPSDADRLARRDAGMALYYLSLAGTNRSKIVRFAGAVRTLLGIAAAEVAEEGTAPPLGMVALMVLCNLAGAAEGRASMIDAGAVEVVVGMMRAPPPLSEAALERCVAALYGMSRGSLRFRGLAREAGAEEVLMRVEGVGRDMAEKAVRAMRGEEEMVVEEGSCVSDGVVSFRRRYKGMGNVWGASSAEF